jgi:hypothetical protein
LKKRKKIKMGGGSSTKRTKLGSIKTTSGENLPWFGPVKAEEGGWKLTL